MTPSRLVDVAYDAIGAALPLSETVDPDDLQAASNSLFTGATERKAAELGKQLAVDYLLLGSVVEIASEYRADIQAVRCTDAAVIGVSRSTAGDWASLEAAVARDIEQLIPSLSDVPDIKIAEEEACLEEASVFFGIADTLAFTSIKDPWVQYQAARTFQVAAMLGQDTPQECRVINRMHVSIINHPLMYKYSKNWKELQQPLSIQMHNNWLIDELSPEIRKQFTLIQAALHFRRNQQPQREYAAMKERLEKDEWRTLDGGF